MNRAILGDEGTVMQFVGDAVMAVFGAPFPQEDHADRAMQAAIAMHEVQRELNQAWQGSEREEFVLGIGLSTGKAAAALLGSEERLEYTLVGDTVNLSQRLQDMARPGNATVLSDATYRALDVAAGRCPVARRDHGQGPGDPAVGLAGGGALTGPAVGYLIRIELRRQAKSLVVLGFLVALVVGTVVASLAGANRSASAFDRYLEGYRSPDAAAFGETDEVTGEEIHERGRPPADGPARRRGGHGGVRARGRVPERGHGRVLPARRVGRR